MFGQGPVDAGKTYLQKDLRVGGGNIDVEQVDHLARGGRDLHRAIGAGEILNGAAKEDLAVLEAYLHLLFGKLCLELAAERLHAIIGCCGAGADDHIEELTATSRFPDDQACLPWGLTIDQDLGWTDGRGFGKLSQADGDALNGMRDVDQHGFVHGHEKLVGGVLIRHTGRLSRRLI